MFEYVTPKKGYDKDEIKGRVLTVIITLFAAAGLFAVLYYATGSV